MLMSIMLLLAATDAPKASNAAKIDRPKMIQGARVVVASIVRAGKANAKSRKPLQGDALTVHYLQTAAVAAREVPEAERAAALSLALGVALDNSTLIRSNPLVSTLWRQVESESERRTRLEVLGEPTTHGRYDLTQHCFVSVGLTAALGPKAAEAAGITKEVLDAQDGGSGFSFADLAADLSGVHLASWLLADVSHVKSLEKNVKIADFILAPKGYEEGLSIATFEKRYGGTRGDKFKQTCAAMKKRLEALPSYTRK